MEEGSDKKRVAIACQGGGSHTAFTAGVLKGLLGSERLQEHEVVGISGTSGGAVCALLTWYHLLGNDAAGASEALDAFWRDNSATAPHEQVVNNWLVWASNLQNFVTTPAVSPYYNPFSEIGLNEFKKMLERRVDFERGRSAAGGSLPGAARRGCGRTLGQIQGVQQPAGRDLREDDPRLGRHPDLVPLRAPRDGGTYWDGLFSQNPPIKELTDEKPDEIWVIQINPSELEDEPRTVAEIADRRNELAGNLSLYQELGFIEKIDQMLEEGRLSRDSEYKHIVVRVIELSRSRFPRSLGAASKMNRDPGFIQDLISHGEDRAEEFLAALAFENAWRSRDSDAVMGFFADDATIMSSAPFPEGGRVRGKGRDKVVRGGAPGRTRSALT